MPINWKNVWDYFYQTVENKMIKDYLVLSSSTNDVAETKNNNNNNSYTTCMPPFSKIVSNPINNTNVILGSDSAIGLG